MKVEYINPFISATVNVFQTMASCTLRRGTPSVKADHQPNHEISGIIGLSGKARGTVVLSIDREVALHVAEAMLGERPAGLDGEVADAVGELTNMVAGQAKAQLEQFSMSVSLPTVISGKGHSIDFPKATVPICVPFTCPHGSLDLEVALVEQPSSA